MTHELRDLSDWESFNTGNRFEYRYGPARLLSELGTFAPTNEFRNRFPILSDLLACSRRTTLEISKGRRHIHAWTNRLGHRFGWVCLPPPDASATVKMHADHRLLLTAFGGIEEHWNGPESFLSNQNGSLGVPHWSIGFGNREEQFQELAEDLYPDYTDVKGDLVPSEYAEFTSEANGDMTMYHLQTAEVLHLGFDCGVRGVTALDAYPQLLYRINAAPDFVSWVETVAQVWLSEIDRAT